MGPGSEQSPRGLQETLHKVAWREQTLPAVSCVCMDGTCLDYLRVSTEASENWRKKDLGEGRRQTKTKEYLN